MSKRMRVKQSKSASLVGMIGGIIFIIIGLTTVMPNTGLFGVFWVLICFVIAGSHAYNFFSDRGISSWEVDIDSNERSFADNDIDFESKLRKLNKLREDGLITEEEFARKREEIMKDKW